MNNVYQIVTDRILDIMKTGKLVWVKNWQARAGNVPQNFVSKKHYNGINFLFLSSLPYSNPYYLTFNQVKNLGGHVKNGERSQPVIFWKINQYSKDKGDGTQETKNVPLLRYYPVFNIEQTEGIEWKMPDTAPKTEHERIEAADSVINNMPQRPDIEYSDFDRACYNKVKDLVTMPHLQYFKTNEAYYSTLFHELAHSTGHVTRLNREELQRVSMFGSEDYGKEELTAELSASFICARIGISNVDNLRNSAAYLQGWSKAIKNDPKMFVHAAARAQKAADFILNEKPETGIDHE